MARATNHLDKLMGTSSQHPGVQLKRTDRMEKTSYQVETKVKGATPARNIGFGSFDSLEKAKRAYNLGMYIMGTAIEDTFYPFPDNGELANFCPTNTRTYLQNAVLTKDYEGIFEMRKLIKAYLEECNCASDSDDFKRSVFRYFQETQKQRKTPHAHASPRLDAHSVDLSSSPSMGLGEQPRAVPTAEGEEQPDPIATDPLHKEQPQLLPTHVRKRPYNRCPVISTTRYANCEEYTNLPAHYYGVIAHCGELGKHEYPPQLDTDGAFVCACFFNHNFNARSERAEAMGLMEEDWLNRESNRVKKCCKKNDSRYLKVCIKRVGYNYEGSECVQEYFKGPLLLRGICQDGIIDFQPDYSIYDELSGEEENPPVQVNAKVFLDENNLVWAQDPRTNQSELLVLDSDDRYCLQDPVTKQLQVISWDDSLNLYILDMVTNEYKPKLC